MEKNIVTKAEKIFYGLTLVGFLALVWFVALKSTPDEIMYFDKTIEKQAIEKKISFIKVPWENLKSQNQKLSERMGSEKVLYKTTVNNPESFLKLVEAGNQPEISYVDKVNGAVLTRVYFGMINQGSQTELIVHSQSYTAPNVSYEIKEVRNEAVVFKKDYTGGIIKSLLITIVVIVGYAIYRNAEKSYY